MSEEPPKKTTFERHAQSLVQVFIAGICAWMAMTTSNTATEVAVLSERMVAMKIQISRLENGTSNRYTADDAKRDFTIRDEKIKDLQSRVRLLERGQ